MFGFIKSVVVKSSATVLNVTSSAKTKVVNSVVHLGQDIQAEADLQKAKARMPRLKPEDLEVVIDSEGRQVYAYKDFAEKA
jgi:uncharacterized pyridoxal phosphate-containing UPF0001 family protein